MILDFYDIEDDDQMQVESGIILLMLVAFLTVFYQMIADNAGPEL